MFNSYKIGDSPRVNNSIHKTMNETANGIPRSFLQPKITSTPLIKRDNIFATPPKPHILSPRRYSLSEIATPPRQQSKRNVGKMYPTGPLLTSAKYNLNVSTYEDTKSPGLASRIVQYSEEAEREREHQRTPTHHPKYGSPGLFPVVHLFKKDLPVLEQKPRRVTIRIASPEYSRYHSQEYNRKLLEGIVKPNSPNNSKHLLASPSSEGTSSTTRSVLDALKEISRKRIHANEEYDVSEDTGKRIRTENLELDSNKRGRDESPLLDSTPSPTKPSSKKICMYDEYAASCSSMNFLLEKSNQLMPKRKSISISTLTDNPKESKQVKLISVETQTITNEEHKPTQSNEVSTGTEEKQKEQQQNDDKPVKKKESPVKIFDDAPLERIRKNRLAALMGSLAGKDVVLAPKPDYSTVLSSEAEKPKASETNTVDVLKPMDKPLISILASPKRDSPSKSNKHVHFSIPESTSQTILTTPSVTGFSITQSSASITSPISSTYEVKSSFEPDKGEKKLETPAPPSSPVGLTPSSSEISTVVPVPTFGIGSNSSSATSIVSKESSSLSLDVSMSKADNVPSFQFKSPMVSSISLGGEVSNMPFSNITSASSHTTFGAVTNTAVAITTSPPKTGGFKFELSKPAVTSSSVTTSSTATFSFGVASQNKPIFEATATSTTIPNSTNNLSAGFSFGTNTNSLASTTTTSSFSTSNAFEIASIASTAPMAPAFKFGPSNADNKSSFGFTNPTGISFGSTGTPTGLTFGAKTDTISSVSTSVPTFGVTKSSAFSFGTSSTNPKPSGFGTSTTAALLPFGISSTTASSGFGVPSTTSSSGFGAPSTTVSSGFGASSTTGSRGFGAISSSGFGTTSASLPSASFGATTTTSIISAFGVPSASTSSNFGTSTAPMFGDTKSASPFSIPTTTSSAFGTSASSNSSPFAKTASFGPTATPSSFGVPTTSVSFGTTNAFGGTTTTSSVFGTSSGSTGFGKPTNASSIFGAVANTQSSGFGTTSSKPLFGVGTAPPFGSTTPATTTPAFGSTATPGTFNFGAKTTASSTFGGNNVFGTTTSTSTGFGAPAAPTFGNSNVFSGGSSNFGTTNAFGGSSTPAFGTATTTSQSAGFGATNTSAVPAFGSSTDAFGTNTKNSVFGNSSTSAFGSNATPSFGTSAPSTGFGMANNTSGFGTTTGSAFAKTPNAFGSASSTFGTNAGFGTSQPQSTSFNAANPPTTQTGVFNFGTSAAPKPVGVFSFGAASSSEPLKPSFNFTAGNSTPAFGNSGAPSFGNAATPSFGAGGVSQFNAPQGATTGMFSIGSGSSSGRTRTQLKAKRRT